MSKSSSKALPSRLVVVIYGPPLPGRAALVRALERHLPDVRRLLVPPSGFPADRVIALQRSGKTPMVEGDLATARERVEAVRRIVASGTLPLLVEWRCEEQEAHREVYRRYATLPHRYADRWWTLWEADRVRREPSGDEVRGSAHITVEAGKPIGQHVEAVVWALGMTGVRPPSRPPPRRVLVVDDEDSERTLLAETLALLGCQVFAAANATEALTIFAREALDLVITDQLMPHITGTELAAELARRRPDVYIALLTGYAEETIDEALRIAGVDLLLAKPASGSDLLRMLDDLTGKRPTADS
ncbi:MAG: response regulator [Pseudomonadota bacterium]